MDNTDRFDEINNYTGFANGEKFANEMDVRAYFNAEYLTRAMPPSLGDDDFDQRTLDEMADTVIENRWWMETAKMEFININNYDYHNHGSNQSIWESCESPIFWVCDDQGVAVANAQCRHLLGKFWIYADDIDGYLILDEYEIGGLNLLDHEPGLGFDRDGSVKPIIECFK